MATKKTVNAKAKPESKPDTEKTASQKSAPKKTAPAKGPAHKDPLGFTDGICPCKIAINALKSTCGDCLAAHLDKESLPKCCFEKVTRTAESLLDISFDAFAQLIGDKKK